MAPTPLVGRNEGVRVTVNTLMKTPTIIPRRIIDMHDQNFLVDALLRKAGNTDSGLVQFFETNPLFAADDPKILDDFGQIPITTGSTGTPRVARAVRRALGIRVSKTMRDRNSMSAVEDQMTQIHNTMVRAWEDALFSAFLANPNLQTVTTDTAWGSTASHIRFDINAAKFVIKNSASDTAGKQKLGYRADTLVISTNTEFDFVNSDEVSKPYQGNVASENLKFTGKMPNKFLDLDVVVSWRLSVYAPNAAMVMQRNVVGGISDERPLSATPMYPEGNGPNGGPTESFRSDTTRASAIFIDNPKACVLISGVNGTEVYPAGGVTLHAPTA